MTLHVATIVEDTDAEGPGRRFAVWVKGCTIRCPGCCNPEMFERAGATPHEPEALARRAGRCGVEGVTVLGGEPFEQALAVARFAEEARARGLSVMVFSGYTLEALRARRDAGVDALLAATDLLVDGPYDARAPEPRRRWIGSTNQRLHFLTDRYDPTDPCFEASNELELRFDGHELVVSGWPTAARRVLARARARARGASDE